MARNERDLDKQMAMISGKAGQLPETSDPFNATHIQLQSGDTAVVLNLRDKDVLPDDFPSVGFFVNVRFVKKLRTGTWHGGGDKFTNSTELGKILDRSMLNQANENEEFKAFLKEKGYSFEEPEK